MDSSQTIKQSVASLSTLIYEQHALQNITTRVQDDVAKLQQEIEKLELEKRWCFNESGIRIIPTPHEEALRISQSTAENPDSENEVILALKQKKTSLQMEVSELEETLKQAQQQSSVKMT
ncbi:uncharacterized protein [Haliotis cracherodii]|uniref:uncharacterized protein LOC124140926 n=1 Tax=Haliotis rufescens TaxID=6454 RepID=UPI001EB0381F|nr:uncharacterized protein LOC124140926 [Haliotis rufescens]